MCIRDRLYLDGALKGTVSGAPNVASMPAAHIGTGVSAGFPAGCPSWCSFWGNMADIAYYNHPLDANRVAAHYQAGLATLTGSTAVTFTCLLYTSRCV